MAAKQRERLAVPDEGIAPYQIGFTVRGVKSFFFNAPRVDGPSWDQDAPKTKAKENLEIKVWRDDGGRLALPGYEFVKAIADAARGFPDPTKSGHKSMRPVVTKAMAAHEELVPFFASNGRGRSFVKQWDDVDARLARFGNNRMGPQRRPILRAGWQVAVSIDVTWPEIFAPADIAVLMSRAGLLGVGDARTLGMGRFVVVATEPPREISWS
jgi:hypothetical protein